MNKFAKVKEGFWFGEFVLKKYAFELDIIKGESYYYSVRYPFEHDVPPADLKGEYFKFVLGTTY